jgi:hypothetical protein
LPGKIIDGSFPFGTSFVIPDAPKTNGIPVFFAAR